jgi:hypothetical protein
MKLKVTSVKRGGGELKPPLFFPVSLEKEPNRLSQSCG